MRHPPLLPALLATLLLGGCGGQVPVVPKAAARPLRVMSINLCTDQLVLALLPPDRIASVSWLARDAGGSLMARAAHRVPINHGQAEDVLAQRPDLVVAGSFTTPALRASLKRLGYPLLEVDEASSFAGIRAVTRRVAAAVGEAARGEALLADMDRKLARLAAEPGPGLRVVAWDRTGFSAGEGTLYDAILTAAGADNLARAPAASGYRRPDVEVLLAAAPALLMQGSIDPRIAGLGDDVMRHRLVRRIWGTRTLTVPQAYYACGTPMVADAAVALHARLRTAAIAGVGSGVGSGMGADR